MADKDKKDEKKKPAEGTSSRTVLEEIIWLLAGLFLLSVIVNQLFNYFTSIGFDNTDSAWAYFLHSYFFPFWTKWKVIAVVISALSLLWASYSYYRIMGLIKDEEKIFGPVPKDSFLDNLGKTADTKKNEHEQWQKVMKQSESSNPPDWRLAIIEADIMLEEALRTKGFPGATIGEMLKSAQPGDFLTLEAAWEAHKVRNKIAHAGSDFQLTERETRRATALYEAVFKEFEVI